MNSFLKSIDCSTFTKLEPPLGRNFTVNNNMGSFEIETIADSTGGVDEQLRRIMIAVDATKEPSSLCLQWTMDNLAQPRSQITFLGILHSIDTPLGYKFQADGTNKKAQEAEVRRKLELFEQKLRPLSDLCDRQQVFLDITITAGTPIKEVVLQEALNIKPTYVVLERSLRRDRRYYKEHLNCDIYLVSQINQADHVHSASSLIRLGNLAGLVGIPKAPDVCTTGYTTNNIFSADQFSSTGAEEKTNKNEVTLEGEPFPTTMLPPLSKTGDGAFLAGTTELKSSLSPVFSVPIHSNETKSVSLLNTNLIQVQPTYKFPLLNQLFQHHEHLLSLENSVKLDAQKCVELESSLSVENQFEDQKVAASTGYAPEVLEEQEVHALQHSQPELSSSSGYKDVLENSLAQPPPLCSICNFKSPELGRPLKIFSYEELKGATNNFSAENLIAEGGFGIVYKGTLQDGQIAAVKKLKSSSLRFDVQFTAEVEALSYAQHRNVVKLIGYCKDVNARAIVYEYVCNGSLDQHLSGQNRSSLDWPSRFKVALGTARGLRYLHEECRGGCIVHRDMRPNNILLTHDFTAMVGDFGLAKMSSTVDAAIETQVIGSLGYVAPEYVECGRVTAKTDVYSFGVVLLELISGCKGIDLLRPKGEISLTEWARPRLTRHRFHEIVDKKIRHSINEFELIRMGKAASLCIKKDPSLRPGMSQILRILEGYSDDAWSPSLVNTLPVGHAMVAATENDGKRTEHYPPGMLEQVLSYRSSKFW